MPAWIKTKDDEAKWSKAKDATKKSYLSLGRDKSKYWAIVTSIYKNMNKGKV
jgi:hypothetical protein